MNLSVRVIVDTAAPVVTITSHADGDEVEKTGFLLAGTALDDIAVTSLAASVDDPVLGRTVDRQAVDVTPGSGQWTFTVLNGQMTQGQTVTVRLDASDAKGNRSAASISLLVVAVDFEGTHLINRITFGATPQLYTELATLGPDAFLTAQLAPQTIDDAAFDRHDRRAAAADHHRRAAALRAAAHDPQPPPAARGADPVLGQPLQHRHQQDPRRRLRARRERRLPPERARPLPRPAGDQRARSPAMLIYLDNADQPEGEPERELRAAS